MHHVKRDQQTITANVSAKAHELARKKAFEQKKSIRIWAGEILEAALGMKTK